jgi:hypothetical protein
MGLPEGLGAEISKEGEGGGGTNEVGELCGARSTSGSEVAAAVGLIGPADGPLAMMVAAGSGSLDVSTGAAGGLVEMVEAAGASGSLEGSAGAAGGLEGSAGVAGGLEGSAGVAGGVEGLAGSAGLSSSVRLTGSESDEEGGCAAVPPGALQSNENVDEEEAKLAREEETCGCAQLTPQISYKAGEQSDAARSPTLQQ